MLNKEKIQNKLLIDSRNGIHKTCFICGSNISRKDIDTSNFEVIENMYVHTTCVFKHVPEV